MLPGPVFNVELLTTARRPRYFALRVLYGLALLFIVWQNYSGWDRFDNSPLSPDQMRRFAQSTFYSIVALQGVGILAMTPSLCAGVIANEKQRKTLHYLLASELTSAEIVLGKLLARMLHVAVFLAIGLPVMSLLSLFGGVDPVEAFLATMGSFSTAFFLASLSVLCSTVSKRVKEAISMTYALEGAWLILPLMIRTILPIYYPRLDNLMRPVNDWLLASTPWPSLQSGSFGRMMGGGSGILEPAVWMIGLQFGAGILLTALAVARLRPVFRSQEGSASFRFMGIPLPGGKSRRLRIFDRKPLGDSAMMWKELHTSRTSGAAQVAGLILGVIIAFAIGYGTLYFAWDVIRDMATHPVGDIWRYYGETNYGPRRDLNAFIRSITTSVGVVMIIAAAVGGANTMTSEREDDTWISLVGTPLENREIVLAKMLGVLWKLRWAMFLIGFEWFVGLICGAVHPMGVIFQALQFLAFLSFATALGTFFSTTSKSSWRAQATTIGVLVFCSGGYMACCCPVLFASGPQRSTMLFVAGIMPFLLAVSLVSPWEFSEIFLKVDGSQFRNNPGMELAEIIIASIIGTVLYGGMAIVLTYLSIERFEKAADRPRRDDFQPLFPVRPKSKSPSEIA